MSIFQDCGYALYALRTKSRRFSKISINKINGLPNCGKQKKRSRSTGFPEREERREAEEPPHSETWRIRHGISPTIAAEPPCQSEDVVIGFET